MADQNENDANAHAFHLLVTTLAKLLDLEYVHFDLNAVSAEDNSRPTGLKRYLMPTLPQSLGLYASGDDIRLMCVATMSPRTFWEYVVEKLELDVAFAPESTADSLEFYVHDVEVLQAMDLAAFAQAKLQLCLCTPPKELTDFPFTRLTASIAERDRNMSRIYDQQILHDELRRKFDEAPDEIEKESQKQMFQTTFLRFRQWACSNGLLSPEFKMLDTICLLRICVMSFCQGDDPREMAADSDPLRRVLESNYLQKLLFNAHMPNRLNISMPSGWNLAARLTPEAVQAFRSEVVRTLELEKPPDDRKDITSADDGLTSFLASHELYVTFHTMCWRDKDRAAVNATLPHHILTLQSLIRTSSGGRFSARIWPQQLVDGAEEGDGHGIYVLGLNSSHLEDAVEARSTLNTALADFITHLRYDRGAAFISHKLLDIAELASLMPMLRVPSPAQQPAQAAPDSGPVLAGSRFRTAAAAMDRLRWDPLHAAFDYEVGYLDRFEADLIWKPLEKWERHTEEEEFIPEHRIRKIRRKGAGSVIWDRDARWDGSDGR